MNKIVLTIVAVAILAGVVSFVSFSGEPIFAGVNCSVTQEVIATNPSTSVIAVPAGVKDWAIIQQPENATTTPWLAFGEDAVIGQGYHLGLANATNTPDQIRVGVATDLPVSDAIEVISDSASSTVNVIYCR